MPSALPVFNSALYHHLRNVTTMSTSSTSATTKPTPVPAPGSVQVSAGLPPMIEIGANLMDAMFQGWYHGKKAHEADLDQVLLRSRRANVTHQIVTAGNLKESRHGVEFVAKHDDLYVTAGCHPTRAKEAVEYPQGLEHYVAQIEELIQQNSHRHGKGKIVAVGELGLDYDRLFFSPADQQKLAFEAQLQMAKRVGLPLFLHTRNSREDFAVMLRPHMDELRQAIGGPVGVVHSFTGSVEEMNELLEMGLYIGLNGCSLKTQENIDCARACPLDRLMLETDAPWCEIRSTHASAPVLDPFRRKYAPAPQSNQGKKPKSNNKSGQAPGPASVPAPVPRSIIDLAGEAQYRAYFQPQNKKEKFAPSAGVKGRNEPWAIGQVALVMAGLQGVPVEQVAAKATANTKQMFGL